LRDFKFVKKHRSHVGIVMLTGMDDDFLDAVRRTCMFFIMRRDGPRYDGGFNELRAGADDVDKFH
jgi:hypothetical protein